MTRKELFSAMQELIDAGLISAAYNPVADGWRVSILDPATGGLASPQTIDRLHNQFADMVRELGMDV